MSAAASRSDASPWQPAPFRFFRDPEVAAPIEAQGLTVRPFLEPGQLQALQAIYERHHDIPNNKGGMFYTMYSQDLAYRERVHREVGEVLQPTLDAWFQDYKNIINFYVVKLPGPASEFAIHQDTTILDELRFSTLSIWLPLCDATPENGTLAFLPRSRDMFSPYRGISWPFPFSGISDTVRRYMEPVSVKAGEGLLFDPRTLHTSLPNHSQQERVAVVCGIFPKQADFMTCYRESPEDPIELWSHEEDYLLRFPNFLHHCCSRPVTGQRVGTTDYVDRPVTAEDFEARCRARGLEPRDLLPAPAAERCNMITEPGAEILPPLVDLD